jgi:hypothetical protein
MRDGAGFPPDAAKNGKHEAIDSHKVQLANLLASQDHRRAKFIVGALKFSHACGAVQTGGDNETHR